MGIRNNNQVSWRTNVGSPVNNGSDAMLYTTLADTKLNYNLGTLPAGKIYQLTGNVWRREGGEGSSNFNFGLYANISDENPISQYSYEVVGRNIVNSISGLFAIPPSNTGSVYFIWDVHVNSGSFANAGIWGAKLLELGNALTVTFNTNGGSDVTSQYYLEGADSTAVVPIEPTKSGYVFKGWYSDAALTAEYDFSTPVVSNITVYAKWENIKDGLRELITTATALLPGGTDKGTTYLQAAINAAQAVLDNNASTTEEAIAKYDSLKAAIAAYQNVELSDLLVNSDRVDNFAPDVLDYIYFMYGTAASAKIEPIGSECAQIDVTVLGGIFGRATVKVTAGNGLVRVYTILLTYPEMEGWDGGGATGEGSEPYNSGWGFSDETIEWSETVTGAGVVYAYRSDLVEGINVLTRPNSNNVMYYPVLLEEGMAYHFSCTATIINNGPATTTFGFNTESDATGTMIASQTLDVARWSAYNNFSFDFVAPTDGIYYMVWYTTGITIDRTAAWNFQLYGLADVFTVTFDTNEGSEIATQYIAPESIAIKPENDPEKAGYSFGGWYSDAGLTVEYDFSTPITSDITLYAKWINGNSLDNTTTQDFKVISVDGGIKIYSQFTGNVNIYAITGQLIKQIKITANETTVSLSNGIYILNRKKVIVK